MERMPEISGGDDRESKREKGRSGVSETERGETKRKGGGSE